jgi:hypothetical protein
MVVESENVGVLLGISVIVGVSMSEQDGVMITVRLLVRSAVAVKEWLATDEVLDAEPAEVGLSVCVFWAETVSDMESDFDLATAVTDTLREVDLDTVAL